MLETFIGSLAVYGSIVVAAQVVGRFKKVR